MVDVIERVMSLKVLHYYILENEGHLERDLTNGIIRFTARSSFFLTNCIIVWEMNRGRLYICEIYSKNNGTYQKTFIDQILEDDNKNFLDWFDCDVTIPSYLIPNFPKQQETHLLINIKDGFLQTSEYLTVNEGNDEPF